MRQRRSAGGGASEQPEAPSSADDSKARPSLGGAVAAALPEDADIVTRNERWVPWVLTALAAFTRFYRLDKPPGAGGGGALGGGKRCANSGAVCAS